jgi:hypothetical protein
MTAAERQGALFSQDPEEFREAEGRGIHTAARLMETRPATYRAIVKGAAEGRGQLAMADLLAVSVHTVRAVLLREGAAIAEERKALADQFMAGARIAAEAALDMIADKTTRSKCNALQLATAAAIMTDKAELLTGNAQTIRIEVEHRASAADFSAMVAEARRRMHSGGGEGGQKGDGARQLEADQVTVGPAPGTTSGQADGIDDVVSDVASACGGMVRGGDACGDALAGTAAEVGGRQAGADPGAAGGGGGGRAIDGGAST